MKPAERLHEASSDFLPSGEMGALIRSFPWSDTAIGPSDNWSPALHMMIRILLANRFPLLLWWGPEYISIYNDAYRPILGRKHPSALGQPVSECWAEIWHVWKPLIDTPFQGGPATWIEDIELQINRAGFTEETHFTVAYSPVPDETAQGGIGGVLATVHEITEKVIGERRAAILRDLGTSAMEGKTAEEACGNASNTLGRHAKDIPFALLYLVENGGRQARLAASCGVDTKSDIAPVLVELDDAGGAWPFSATRRTEHIETVDNLGSIFSEVPHGTWPERPHMAAVIPIRSNIAHQLSGFFVAGLSSHLAFDDAYRNFLDLAGVQIATVIAAARAYAEERRRAEALAEIDRAKTAFFSNVSHEFRTPLTLMLGPLEWLLEKDRAIAAEDREQLETAHRNSLRLLKLVNSLLDFSRIEAGRVRASYEPVDLAALTADLAANFRSAMEAAGLDLIVDCTPLSEPVYVDREMWKKIVLNLLSNAFKFTFEGRVMVRLERGIGSVVLTVADTGVGIPEAEIPHVFTRFHRVEGAKGRTYEGTGIGLALIQELVKLHGGTVEVRSRPGEGSTFIIALPMGSAHLPPERIGRLAEVHISTAVRAEAFTREALTWLSKERQPQRSNLPTMPGGHSGLRPRILIADDNADMREHVSHILGNDYDLTCVGDGAAALKAARENMPDLVLCDVMMPGLDGFAFLKEFRNDPRLRELPVILLSARAGEEARTEGIAAGADDYLTKPFHAGELIARVETTLKLQRLRRESRKEIEQANTHLQQRTAQFETLLNRAPIGVYLVDADLCIRDVNPTARLAFGDMPDLIGREFGEVVRVLWPRELAEELLQRFRHTLETGESYFTPEMIEHRLDRGVTEHHEWRIDRIPLPDGRFGVVCYFRDISVQVRAREELRRINQDLEQFAYSASHDLQEPLRAVKIYSELLSDRYREKLDGEGLEFLDYMRGGATRMEMLIRDLLAYTQAGKFDTPAENENATDALNSALENLSAAILESGAKIRCDPMPSVPVHGTQLQQLFQNLVGNAIKYRRPEVPPVVHVSVKRQDRQWLFCVSDNGIGIDAEFKERIFGLFKRLHTADQYSGTGIGLAICQRIVDRYDGRIWVESEPGKGAQFFFTLPA